MWLESEIILFIYAPESEKSGISNAVTTVPRRHPKHPSVLYAYATLIPNITNPQTSSIIHRRGITQKFGTNEVGSWEKKDQDYSLNLLSVTPYFQTRQSKLTRK